MASNGSIAYVEEWARTLIFKRFANYGMVFFSMSLSTVSVDKVSFCLKSETCVRGRPMGSTVCSIKVFNRLFTARVPRHTYRLPRQGSALCFIRYWHIPSWTLTRLRSQLGSGHAASVHSAPARLSMCIIRFTTEMGVQRSTWRCNFM